MSAFTARPLSLFAALARPSCPECGATSLVWTSARDLAWGIPLEDRVRLFDLVGFTGQEADAWRCPGCQNWGVFDSSHDW